MINFSLYYKCLSMSGRQAANSVIWGSFKLHNFLHEILYSIVAIGLFKNVFNNNYIFRAICTSINHKAHVIKERKLEVVA